MRRQKFERDDARARRLAQTEFSHPVAIEAGAGTGKTTVLVSRILGWCLGPGWQRADEEIAQQARAPAPADVDQIAARVLDGVVAITFTEAAASEMATRVAAALADLATNKLDRLRGFDLDLITPPLDDSSRRLRARALIGALDHLAVRTIHAHCWHLLTTYPLASGIAPELTVDAEGTTLEEVGREVVEDAVKQAYAAGLETPLTRLALLGYGPAAIFETVKRVIELGLTREAFAADPLGEEQRLGVGGELVEALAALDRTVEPMRALARNLNAARIGAATTASLSALQGVPSPPEVTHLAELRGELFRLWADSLLKHLDKWASGVFNDTEQKSIGAAQPELVAAARRAADALGVLFDLDPALLETARRALIPLVDRVERGLHARGTMTYGGLLRTAWQLLSRNPSVLAREQRRMHQLLVDEFQDTDRNQCEIVRLLGLSGPQHERPGLFVVGDPKQSIYGWRNADLESYSDFLGGLQEAGGRVGVLSRNFRSAPPILDEVTAAIAPVMYEREGLQPAFEPLTPSDHLAGSEGFTALDRRSVEAWVSWEPWEAGGDPETVSTSAEAATRLEAEAIARDILELHTAADIGFRQFGLLLRSMTPVETYLEAFRRFGVPFVVGKDKQYFRRREIVDVAAWMRAIMVPVDHVALVTMLRSPAVGVPDAALLPLWRRGFPAKVTDLIGPEASRVAELREMLRAVAASLPEDIPGLDAIQGWEMSAAAALENLARLRAAARQLPTDRFIELFRQATLVEAGEAARFLGGYRLANLDRFFRTLETSLEDNGGDTQALLRTLRRAVAEGREEEEGLPEGAAKEAVQVMSIHGAKGLEFDHVYLARLHSKPRGTGREPTQVDHRWLPGNPAQYVIFGASTPGFRAVRRHAEAVREAEAVRTLYVAMTRARQRLVLIGNWPRTVAAAQGKPGGSYLDLLVHRQGHPDSVVDLMARCAATGTSSIDEAGIRWRFPGLAPAAGIPHSREPSRVEGPAISRIESDAMRLETLRKAAGERMQRPWSTAASAEASFRLRRLMADEPTAGDGAPTREVAMTVGNAFHRMLETWDLEADPRAELKARQESIATWLVAQLAEDSRQVGIALWQDLMRRFGAGSLFQRWIDLRPHVVARELPVVLPPAEGPGDSIGFVTGTIDLLARDPDTRTLLIVDFKTDRVDSADAVAARAEAYQTQEAVYARALVDAFELSEPPSGELWFVWSDTLWELPTGESL